MLVGKDNSLWDLWIFEKEVDLDRTVAEYYQFLFGDQSLYFGESEIKTGDGFGTRPDGFVINLETRRWYIVEAELAAHQVFGHIVPQVTKQILASREHRSRVQLRHRFTADIRGQSELQEIVRESGVDLSDLDRVIESVLETEPIVAIPIDESSEDLRTWAKSLRFEVQILEIKRYRHRVTGDVLYEFPDPDAFSANIVSEREDNFDSTLPKEGPALVRAMIEAGHLKVGDGLFLNYKGREFRARVTASGHIELPNGGQHSVSTAAIKCMQLITPSRKTHNGWYIWRTEDGRYLSDLREAFYRSFEKKIA